MLVQDVGGLAGRGLCGLGQELRLRQGHVEVKGPVFQPLLLPVDLRDVLSSARHLWKNSREKGDDNVSVQSNTSFHPDQEVNLRKTKTKGPAQKDLLQTYCLTL